MEKLNLGLNKTILSALLMVMAFVVMPELKAEAATNDEVQACAAVFDGDYYAALYPDVAASTGGSHLAMLNHYIYYGIYEGRNASPYFNATDYMNKNPDLQAVYGANMLGYVYHYVHSGSVEGRDALPTVGAGIEVPHTYTLLSTYTTEFEGIAPRGTNITLAAKNVNGTVVAPGQTFSANNAIGKRTVDNGYVEAPVFINKEHAMGIGGGVCQVSSTIYAATKGTNLKITERHAHSLPVAYLPEGWDATISWGTLDMKFVNTYDSNIVVWVTTNNGSLTAAIYLQN